MKKPELQNSLPEKIEFGFSLNMTDLFENAVMYLIISGYSLEREQQLQKIQKDYLLVLDKQPKLKSLIIQFLTPEIISCSPASYNITTLSIFSKNTENYIHHAEAFQC